MNGNVFELSVIEFICGEDQLKQLKEQAEVSEPRLAPGGEVIDMNDWLNDFIVPKNATDTAGNESVPGPDGGASDEPVNPSVEETVEVPIEVPAVVPVEVPANYTEPDVIEIAEVE